MNTDNQTEVLAYRQGYIQIDHQLGTVTVLEPTGDQRPEDQAQLQLLCTEQLIAEAAPGDVLWVGADVINKLENK